MHKKHLLIAMIVVQLACAVNRAYAQDSSIPGTIACSRVFVTDDQLYAVQWADQNLFKSACMAPQASAATATFILELRSNPALARAGLTSGAIVPKDPANYSVRCYSIGDSTTCKDFSGVAYTTTCHRGRLGVECDSYNGVGMAEALVMLPLQILLRNAAHAYLFDAKTNVLVWIYDGDRPWDREFAYASKCEKQKRAGVWGVPDSQKYRCDENKLPMQLLENSTAEPPPSSPPEHVDSPAERAKKAHEYADCLNVALTNSQVTCNQ